eukprot:1225897-Prymnesium_polylepis.1
MVFEILLRSDPVQPFQDLRGPLDAWPAMQQIEPAWPGIRKCPLWRPSEWQALTRGGPSGGRAE